MVCRLLRSLQGGKLPDDGGALAVDGIVYLSNTRAFHRVTVPDLYGGLTKLLPEETVKHVEVLYKNPQASTEKRIQALVEAFPRGRTIILLDNFEDALTIDTGQIKDAELNEALHALLKAPPNALKAIITTRVAPSDLPLVEPALQRRVDLDTGLPFPDAKKMLQAMDVDGKVGLQHADDALLAAAWERTRGYPRPLEHLFAVLSADRDTTLKDLLEDTKDFLPEQVVEVLVGEAFSRLDATAQLVMQGLATYRYPVIPTAVDYLLQPHVTGLTSSRVLSRLVNMQFVRRDAGRYYLHQVDLDYALSRIPKGDPGDSKADVPQFTQFALRHRAAEWFKLIRKPGETWKSLEDLSAQLSEFDLRCEAEEYDTAAVLLGEFDFDYLFLWGHYRLMVERHERLQGKIADPFLAKNSVGNLGSAYYRMGRHRQAIVCYEEALRLAQENKDRWNEGVWLGNLGAAVSDIGQTARAIEYLEQALAIRREVGDRGGEALDLANLGFMYDAVGQLSRAVDYYKEALDIDRSVAKKVGVTDDLTNLGSTYIHLGQYDEALESLRESLAIAREIDYRIREADALNEMGHLYLIIGKIEDALRLFEQSIEIADDIGAAKFQNESRTGAATASLYNGDLPAARKMAEAASGYRVLLSDALTATILGVVACRQQDPSAAHKAFTAAIGQVDELLTMTPDLHDVLYTKALALSGLALCGDTKQIPAAREAFAAARKVTSAAGVVRRVLQLFDALAIGDANHILTDVRSVAAGAN